MNSFGERYLRAEYDEMARLSKTIAVMRRRSDGRLIVKKSVDAAGAKIYRRIKDAGISGLPQIYSVEPEGNGFAVFYEYISGVTVEERVRNGGALPESEARGFIIDICRTLSRLHKMNIIHRDVTASNIVLGADGRAYLIDLGISRRVKSEKNSDTEILGTAGFAPPEQFGFRQTDERSDIYSVGVLMLYMLDGKMPSGGETNTDYKRIAAKCMAFEPNNRYSSAEEVIAALENSPHNAAAASDTPKKRSGIGKYIFSAAAIFIIAMVIIGSENAAEALYYSLGTVFYILIPIAAIFDFFGIVRFFERKYEWRIREKIGIRIFISLWSIIIFSIIGNLYF